MKICIAQLNIPVGDIWGNAEKIVSACADAKSQNAELVVFPELAITGYPPEDLLLRPEFCRQEMQALEKAAAAGAGEAVVKLMRDAAVKQDGMHFTPKALFECVAAEVAAASTPVVEREAPVAVPVPTAAPAFRTKPGRASGLSGASSTAAGGVPSYMRPTAASERRREAVLRGKKAAEAKVNAKEATAFKKVLTVVSGDPLSGLRPVDPTSGPL